MTRVLADTSIWIDHFRKHNAELTSLLKDGLVLTHSVIIGELACGHLPDRQQFLSDLQLLPFSEPVNELEVLQFVEIHKLYGKGLGWIDVQILASAALSNAAILTLDKSLKRQARRIL